MKKTLIKAFVLLMILFAIIYAAIQIETREANDNPLGAKDFSIEKGQGVGDIAKNLQCQGFLKKPNLFKIYVWLNGYRAKFFDGVYDLRTDMSVKQLVDALIGQRDLNREAEIKILEGWTDQDIDAYLAKQGLIQKNDFVEYSNDYNSFDYPLVLDRASGASLQGYFYPDTYRVYRQADAEAIAKKMLDNFSDKLTPELRQEIKRQKKSIFEVVILASIVEKEISGYENRQIVAGIFQKRLKIGMALQSDATVNYITKKGLASPSLDDTKVDSLYNTYKYKGLPPGPICNPSIEAIKAVIYPGLTTYWYFLTTPDGKAYFGATYDEHLKNKYKYL
ncbi:MAG: endolytic transglycosylase MltG [Parcubacteria group bacterium]